MKGLDGSILKRSELENLDTIGSEYYLRRFVQDQEKLRTSAFLLEQLSNCCTLITDGDHGVADYQDEGVPFILSENVKMGWIDTSNLRRISHKHHQGLKRSQMKSGDVLVTKTGVYFGKSAVFDGVIGSANTIAHVGLLRPKPTIDPYFLSIFLNCRYGQSQLRRRGIKATRPEIKLVEFQDIEVPIPSEAFAGSIKAAYLKSDRARRSAAEKLQQALEAVELALGLDGWVPPEPVSYVQKLSALQFSKRIDAEHFDPRHLYAEEVIARRPFGVLGDLAEFVTSGPAWPSSSFTTSDDPDGKPFVRIRNCKPGQIEIEELDRLLPSGIGQFKSEMARSGDLAIGMDGIKWFYAGRMDGDAYINQRVGWVRLKPGGPTADYVQLILNSPLGQAQLLRRMTIAQTVGHITLDDIRSVKIPVFDDVEMGRISFAVRSAAEAKEKAKQLLEAAKRAVEIAIEDGEPAAMAFLDKAEEAI